MKKLLIFLLGFSAGLDAMAASSDEAEICYEKESRYCNGGGVAKDVEKMVRWWRKDAEQGHAGAQFILGCCYYRGEGV